MVKLTGYILLIISLTTTLRPYRLAAQETNSFNLNTDEGLPSNHVYGTITDRNGYLWICTDKGICRYNGYTFTYFDVSDGLPTDDIWELLEDRKGRIWLGNISKEIGYIYNDKYHKAKLKNIKGTLYPTHIRMYKDGIVFYTPYNEAGAFHTYCYQKNDTIYGVATNGHLKKLPQNIDADRVGEAYVHIDELGSQIRIIMNRYIYKQISGHIQNNNTDEQDNVRYVCEIRKPLPKEYGSYRNYAIGDNILSYSPESKTDTIYVTNTNTGATSSHSFDLDKGSYIKYIYIEKKPIKGNLFYVVTNSKILKCSYDSGIHVIHRYSYTDFVPKEIATDISINTIHKSELWNICVGSTSYGMWLDYKIPDRHYEKISIHLNKSVCVGNYKDSISFWWNEKSSTLLSVDYNYNVFKYDVASSSRIKQISSIAKDTFFVLANTPLLLVKSKKELIRYKYELPTESAYAFTPTAKDEYIFAGLRGLMHVSQKGKGYHMNSYDFDRYLGLFYDSMRKKYWVYNNNKLLIKNEYNDEKTTITKLNNEDINDIEWAGIENNYGNVFLKPYDHMMMYDFENNKTEKIFKGFRIKGNTAVFSYNNKLIVVWKYGILFSVIRGKMSVSEPLWYPNAKNIKYDELYSAVILNNNLLLNTDKGVYSVRIPGVKKILSANDSVRNSYRFIAKYGPSAFNIKQGDTIEITPADRKILFDVINPYGVGDLKYRFSYEKPDKFTTLNSNELNTSESFIPDHYYKLFVYAYDDSWESKVMALNLYIKPHWWQTRFAVRVIWTGSILAGLLVIVLVVYLTRKTVLKAAERKQLNMEMELKSIHAQINPHFIFNSLNSALLLVSKNRMDDAYTHISKFSRLLRNYLKSSRNKYITLAEEIENMQNYIELQQTRFRDRFDYNIVAIPELDQSQITIPSLLIQPFVENAINHGILQKKEKGRIDITFSLVPEQSTLICTIEDNGVGRLYSKKMQASQKEKKASYGDLMIQDLISIFSKYEEMRIDIAYTDKQLPETGTIVTISIKSDTYKKLFRPGNI